MGDWNLIECGFNDEDQTLNFGTRCLGGDDNLYEASTLASIKRINGSELGGSLREGTNVNLKCCIKSGQLFYVIEKTLGKFTDLNCAEVDLNIPFEESIDVFYVTDNGKYALIGLHQGLIQFLDVEQKELLLKGKIADNFTDENIFVDVHLQHSTDNEIVFVIVTRIGDIYRIQIKDLQGDCLLEKELLKQMHCDIKNVAFNYPYVFANGCKEMILYNLETGDELEDEAIDVVKVVPYDADQFLVLDSSGNLTLIGIKTLMRFVIATASFKDIIFLQNKESGKCLLVVATKKDETGAMYLQSFESCSNFDSPIFSINSLDELHLIVPECMYNDYLYITDIRKDNIITEFRIQTVYETLKEKRLERLLKRQKFDEAEKFAKLFNLDGTQILKYRANAVVAQSECNVEDVHNLLQILDKINDVHFKLQCCYDMYRMCDDISNVRSILQYAFSRIKTNGDIKEIEDLAIKFTEILNKFDTFTLIQRYNISLRWDDFMQCDMMELLNDYLQKGNIKIATIIYNRIDIKISLTDVENTLSILNMLPLTESKPFLNSFIPISLNRLPSSVIIFVKWLRQKVYDMEQMDFADFPQNAITFTKNVVKLLVHDNPFATFQMESMHNIYQESVEELRMLVKALDRLNYILTKYEISIPLKEYLKGSKSLLHTLLSIRLSEETFNMFFDDFLYNFILENKFHPDDVLLEEIANIICYEESYWVDNVPRYIQKINLIEKKLQAILKIALSAKVPWSHFIKNITATALQYDHPLVSTIVEEISNEPRKTVLMKYNLSRNVRTLDLKFCLNHMLYRDLETMIPDVITITGNREELQLANCMLFHNLVVKRKYEDAFEVLQGIPTEDLLVFCQDITRNITIYSRKNVKCIQSYAPILPAVKRLYKQKVHGHTYETYLDYTFDAITLYFLVKEIHKKVTVCDLLCRKSRTALYDTLINETVNNFESNNSNVDILNTLITTMSKCLNTSKNDVMLKFVEKCNHSGAIQKCAEYYLHEDDPKKLCKMSASIINSILPSNNDLLNLTSDMSMEDFTICESAPTNEINHLISNVRLALKLVIKAALNTEAKDDEICSELFAKIKFFDSITEKCNIEKENIPDAYISANMYAYGGGNVVPSFRTFYTIKDVLDIYVAYASLYHISNTKYFTYFQGSNINLNEVDSPEIESQIRSSIQHLCIDGHVFTAFHLILLFLSTLSTKMDSNSNMISILINFLKKQCIPQLLERVFTSKVIDYQFAYILLKCIDLQQFIPLINQYIARFKKDAFKLNVVMQLTIKIFKHHNINPEKSYVRMLLLSKWWLKIENCQIPMRTFYTSTTKDLLELLLKHKHLKLEMMDEFCKDFQLNLQVCYNCYLEALITQWKPEYEICQKADGKSKLVMKSTEDTLYEECQKVLDLITCKETIPKYIEKFCSSINFYHYEALLCVFNILSSLTNTSDHLNKQELLHFLKMYSRVKKDPSNLELEEWFAAFPKSGGIDPLSQWRLPFSQIFFTEDVWKILRPEINLKTYTIWFKAIPFLYKSLNVDDICTFVVKDVVSSGTLNKGSNNGWTLTPVHESLFEQIDRCVLHISDIERATSVMNHLMIHTPNGADQVNAAVLCLKYTKQYKCKMAADTVVDETCKKIYNKYLKFSVSHYLHLCNLNSEDYSEVLLQPNELIDMLYMHSEIAKSVNAVVLMQPDVNKAVDDIAALYNIDTLQKRKELLEAYLSNNNEMNFGQLTEDIESTNLKRAAYICQSGDLTYWQKHLLTIGADEDVPLSMRVKANALNCLTMISDVETIEAIADLQYSAFLNYIGKLYLLSDLELRGFPIKIEELNSYNKKMLLHRLAPDMHNPITVKIMGDICMVYSIHNTKYWNLIVERSIKLKLYHQLKKYINFWNANAECKYKNFYINAWQFIVDNSFSAHESDDKSDKFNFYVQNILMIQSCPVLHSLKFDQLFNKLCQMNKYEFAAVIIQYMPVENQEELVWSILDRSFSVPHFSPLEECGISGIDLVIDMFKTISKKENVGL